MGEFVRLEVDGAVATIRLDRPPMNALNAAGPGRAAGGRRPRCPARADVRAVVLYGGEKIFAAGADIKEMAEMSYTDMVERSVALCRPRSPRSPGSRSR